MVNIQIIKSLESNLKYSPRCNDEELPPDFQEYSDDEQESKVGSKTHSGSDSYLDFFQARQKKKIEKMVEKGVDPSKVLVMRDF